MNVCILPAEAAVPRKDVFIYKNNLKNAVTAMNA